MQYANLIMNLGIHFFFFFTNSKAILLKLTKGLSAMTNYIYNHILTLMFGIWVPTITETVAPNDLPHKINSLEFLFSYNQFIS